MKPSEVIEKLLYFNEWRRGADTEMPNPKEIGQTIDRAIEIINRSIDETEQAERNQAHKKSTSESE